MSDLNHTLYTAISFIITVTGLLILSKKLTKEEHKAKVLKISALLTVVIHFSSVYVDYFSGQSPVLEKSMLLPIYPCNLAMWLLLVVAFIKNKNGKVFEFLSLITFYLGLIGGLIGIIFNEIYISNPNLLEWGVLKGLLSHSTMLFGCLYLLVGGYLKIGVSNLIQVIFGLLLLIADGALMILLHVIFKLDPPNSMYLLEIPFASLPWFNVLTIGILAVVVIFIATALYEFIAYKKEDRWYIKLSNLIREKHNKKSEV